VTWYLATNAIAGARPSNVSMPTKLTRPARRVATASMADVSDMHTEQVLAHMLITSGFPIRESILTWRPIGTDCRTGNEKLTGVVSFGWKKPTVG
jgi:hypothetical protein